MYPIYVLEGADAVGKTTLGKYMEANIPNAKYFHATYRFRNKMHIYHHAVLEQALKAAETGPVILDRWWPSEAIYAEVFRGGTPWPMLGRMMDRVALQYGVTYIACVPQDIEKHEARFKAMHATGRELYDSNDKVAEKYRAWYEENKHREDFILYDMDQHGYDLSAMLEMFKYRTRELWTNIPHFWHESRQWTGQAHEPTFLIIGERSNPKGRHELWPFFEHANSSLWFTECLQLADVPEHKIAWMNAFDNQGWSKPAYLEMIVDKLKPKHIVSLGGKADKVCFSAGITKNQSYHRLPHPAYVKRFQHGDRTETASLFERLYNGFQIF